MIVWLWTLGFAFRDLAKQWNVLEVLVPRVPLCVCGDDVLSLSTCKLVLAFGMVLLLRAVVRLTCILCLTAIGVPETTSLRGTVSFHSGGVILIQRAFS